MCIHLLVPLPPPCSPGPLQLTYSSSIIISACGRVRLPDEAAAWLQRMEAAGVAPNAVCFNNVIQAYGRASDPDAAVAWLRRMEACGLAPNAISFNIVLDTLARSHRDALYEAELLATRMLQVIHSLTRSLTHLLCDFTTYSLTHLLTYLLTD